ncbi:MAG TPA: hypothetical protein PK306_05755 [Aquabacterium sp.]|nr:hypothetical protein [Aquabacterium sp.]
MSQATAIVVAALALRRSHMAAQALDLLDLAMRRYQGKSTDFGDDGLPPAPFALLVAEAIDTAMTPAEWAAWTALDADAQLRAGLLAVWRSEVWPRFTTRFRLVT